LKKANGILHTSYAWLKKSCSLGGELPICHT